MKPMEDSFRGMIQEEDAGPMQDIAKALFATAIQAAELTKSFAVIADAVREAEKQKREAAKQFCRQVRHNSDAVN